MRILFSAEIRAVEKLLQADDLDALLGGQTVAKTETKAFGCTIKRV